MGRVFYNSVREIAAHLRDARRRGKVVYLEDVANRAFGFSVGGGDFLVTLSVVKAAPLADIAKLLAVDEKGIEPLVRGYARYALACSDRRQRMFEKGK